MLLTTLLAPPFTPHSQMERELEKKKRRGVLKAYSDRLTNDGWEETELIRELKTLPDLRQCQSSVFPLDTTLCCLLHCAASLPISSNFSHHPLNGR